MIQFRTTCPTCHCEFETAAIDLRCPCCNHVPESTGLAGRFFRMAFLAAVTTVGAVLCLPH